MPALLKICLIALSGIVAAVVAAHAQGRSVSPPEQIVVSYPSKSITNFPILETARQKGFFQREGLHVSLVYIRGGLDIKTLLTNDPTLRWAVPLQLPRLLQARHCALF